MNFGSALEQVHHRAPLVDCITNFVTVNDCANILLARGRLPHHGLGHPGSAGDRCRRQRPAVQSGCHRQGGVHDPGRAGGQPGRQTRGL